MARSGPWLVAAVVGVAATFAVVTAPRTPSPLGRGADSPPFSLVDLDGGSHSLEDLRGRVVLLNFWATWCKPCEDEMPAMGRLYTALKEQGFELLAISVDDGDAEVRSFRDRLSLRFPVLLDQGKQVSKLYQTYRFPESFLVDRDGVIVERYIGPKEWDSPAYLARIQRLLAES